MKKHQVALMSAPKFGSLKQIERQIKKAKAKTSSKVLAWETSKRAIFFKPLIEDLWKDYVRAEKRVVTAQKRLSEACESKEATAKAKKGLKKANEKAVIEMERLNGILKLSGDMDFFTYESFRHAKKKSLFKMVNGWR